MTLIALRKRRAELLDENAALLRAVETESRELTDDERNTITANLEAADKLAADIALLERQREASASLDAKDSIRIEVKAPNVHKDGKHGFSSPGEFFAAVHAAGPQGVAAEERLLPSKHAAATGLNQAVGSQGGFLVPPTFSTAIWEGFYGAPDNLIARCDQYQVDGESLTMNAVAETSRATGSRFGGVRGYWLAEADQITSSKPAFRQVKLEPKELGVMIYVTDKLLRNAGALESFLTRAASSELLFLVNDAVINGNGTGKPLGILAAGCTIAVAKETGQGADTIVTENISKMWMRRLGREFVWLATFECGPQMDQLNVGVGTAGMLVYMPPGGLSSAPYGTLKGRPVVETEYCAALGDQGDLILADLGAYAVGLKGGIRSDASMHIRFDYAETAFRFMFEIDGQPWLNSPVTPFKGSASNTRSPFVTIAARA